jgi:hypothetical protein
MAWPGNFGIGFLRNHNQYSPNGLMAGRRIRGREQGFGRAAAPMRAKIQQGLRSAVTMRTC